MLKDCNRDEYTYTYECHQGECHQVGSVISEPSTHLYAAIHDLNLVLQLFYHMIVLASLGIDDGGGCAAISKITGTPITPQRKRGGEVRVYVFFFKDIK